MASVRVGTSSANCARMAFLSLGGACFAIAAMVAIGKPKKQLTRLRRNPVSTFTRIDSWDGDAFNG